MKAGHLPRQTREIGYPNRLYLVFLLLAFLSSLGLDYLTWRKGEKAVLFSLLLRRKEAVEAPLPLAEILAKSLEKHGVSPQDIRLREVEGTKQFHIRLPLDFYTSLAPRLEKELREKNISISKKEQEEIEEFTSSWQVKREREAPLNLFFVCLRLAPEKKEEVPLLGAKNRVAIIIDDMGSSLEILREICDLKKPITISILPLSPYAEETARAAHENGLEVMLHLPCESLNHQPEDGGTDGLIHSEMNLDEIKILVGDFLGRVPHIEGVNNHMGSRITQSEPIMREILQILKERNLFFVDSRTTAHSIAYDLSRQMGLRSAFRNVFLDTSVGVDSTREKLVELFELAQKTGNAVGIGHPFPETLEALRKNIHLLEKYGVEAVFASQIVQE